MKSQKYGSVWMREYRTMNKEAWNAYQREYRAKNPERSKLWNRKSALKKRYGMTSIQFEALVQSQKGLCACCSQEMILNGQKSLSVCVDHDHKTGAVRALLCTGCNVAIAHLGEDPARCLSAAAYLIKHGK